MHFEQPQQAEAAVDESHLRGIVRFVLLEHVGGHSAAQYKQAFHRYWRNVEKQRYVQAQRESRRCSSAELACCGERDRPRDLAGWWFGH